MSVTDNILKIKNNIHKIQTACDRQKDKIELLLVSKQQPLARIEEALNAGHKIFAENKVQDAKQKWDLLRAQYSNITLHMIGALQTNKVKEAVRLFDVIHTLDSEKLALELSKEMRKQDKHLPLFVQINTGAEAQKSGISPENLPDFLAFCRAESLNIIGLMCIPPIDSPPALHFALLKKLADSHGLKNLSMGMSHDYEKAIPLGATHIRVGEAAFGTRLEKNSH